MLPSRVTRPLDRNRDHALVLVRAFLGTFLIYMSQDNVFHAARMTEFEGFLTQFGFPWPALSARLSVYAQFVAGVLVLLGLATRAAALVMVVNFLVALAMVHTRLPFREALDPLAMLTTSLVLLLQGPGPLALDGRRARRGDAAGPA